tara:strand:+ start:171 stop:494 length:324 start_codon:yes stop_codon:yes gene_type:complete
MTVYTQTNAPVYTIDNVYLQTHIETSASNNQNMTSYTWRVAYTLSGEDQAIYMCGGTDIEADVNANTPVIDVRLAKDDFIANVVPFINTHSVVLTQSSELEKNDWRS